MKSFLKKIILFILLLWISSYGMHILLDLYLRNFYDVTSKAKWSMNQKDHTLDYVFLGTSRMSATLAMGQLDSAMRTHSLNIATAASSYGENYAIFQQFIKNGNKAKTLVLTFDLFKSVQHNWQKEAMTPLIFKNMDFFPWMDSSEIREVYLDHNPAWKYTMWKYLPISRNVEFNHYYKVDLAVPYWLGLKEPYVQFNTQNGEQLNYHAGFDGKKKADPGSVQLGPRGEKYLFKILELAHENKMNVVLITAPYFKPYSFDRKEYKALIDSLHTRYGARYIDFSTMEAWNNPDYFTDKMHTTHIGSRVFTKALCDSLTMILND